MARRDCQLLAITASILVAWLGSLAQAQTAITTIPHAQSVLGIVVNSATNKIYVAGLESIMVIDGATDAVTTIDGFFSENGLAVNPATNTIYSASGLRSGLPSVPVFTVLDGATNAVKASLPGFAGPIAVNSVTNKIYVAQPQSPNVVVVDGATNATVSIPMNQTSSALAINTVTNKVYVSVYNNVTIIDGFTNRTLRIDLGLCGPLAVNPVTNKIYVTHPDADRISIIDGITNAVTTVVVGANPGFIAVNPITNKIYAGVNGPHSVAVIDGVTSAVTFLPMPGAGGINVAVNATANKIYATSFGDPSITIIDGTTNALTSLPMQPQASAMGLNPATGKVYVGFSSQSRPSGVAILSSPGAGAPATALTVNSGAAVAMDAQAGGNPLPVFHWSRNGVALADGAGISGATTGTLYLSAAAAQAGAYSWTATNALGSGSGNGATLAVANTSTPGRLINLSARAYVGTGANVLITGYVVSGSAPLLLLRRASGPALIPLQLTGVLADPQIRLYSGSSLIDTNAGWAGTPLIAAASTAVGAFAWSDPSSKDSALLGSQNPGAYTAITSSVSGGSGVALAEVYDATPAGTWNSAMPRLGDIAARASVGTGANVLIAGFVIGGSTAKTVLIRASGPALASLNLTDVLADPLLQLYSSSTLVARNAGWNGNAAIAAAAGTVGAFPWGDPTSRDSALLLTLSPGSYTAVVSGVTSDTGLSLIEVYDVP